MRYSLMIDDERFPPESGVGWYLTRNMAETKEVILKYGCPVFISFDHDLGEDEPTGFDILKWIVECDMDGIISFPDDFTYYVHSQNPCGRDNIIGYLDQYLKIR